MENNRIYINGEIGDWYSKFEKGDLFTMTNGSMAVYIDSPGGDVFEGMAIAALLRNHAALYNVEVRTIGIGMVASIATMPLLAGTRVEMDKDAFLMIHNPFAAYVSGGAKELRQTASTLDTIKETLANAYVEKIEKNGKLIDGDKQKTKNIVLQYMAAETWFSAQEALDFGLIDGIAEYTQAITDMSILNQQRPDLMERTGKMLAQFSNLPAKFKSNMSNEPQKNEEVETNETGMFKRFLAFLGFKAESPAEAVAKEPTQETAPEAEAPKAEMVEMTEDEMTAKLIEKGYDVKKKEVAETEIQNLATKIQALEMQLKAQGEELAKAKAMPIVKNETPAKESAKAKVQSPFTSIFARFDN